MRKRALLADHGRGTRVVVVIGRKGRGQVEVTGQLES